MVDALVSVEMINLCCTVPMRTIVAPVRYTRMKGGLFAKQVNAHQSVTTFPDAHLENIVVLNLM